MRKILPWMSILILIPLAACSFAIPTAKPKQPAAAVTPTLSNEQMQTQLANLLTMMPTTTGQPAQSLPATATPAAPAGAVATETATPAVSGQQSGYPAPAATATPQPVMPTPAPTATPAAGSNSSAPTATPAAAQAGGGQGATATSYPTATPAYTTVPSGPNNPATVLGAPAATDLMNDANTWNWPTGSDEYSEAWFYNGQQAIKGLTTKDGWRLANPKGQQFSDIYLETVFAIKSVCHQDAPGMADHYGVVVRFPDLFHPVDGYLFSFNCNGQYSLRSWAWNGEDVRRQDMKMLIDWTTPKDKTIIRSGTQTSNVMGIKTVGSKIFLYANGYYLASYDISTNSSIPQIPSGYFGAFVGSRTDDHFTVWVDQMSYWLTSNPVP